MKTKGILIIAFAVLMVFTLSVPDIEADAALPTGISVAIEVNEGIEKIGVCIGSTFTSSSSSAKFYTADGTFSALKNTTVSWYAWAKDGYTLDSGSYSGSITIESTATNYVISPTAHKDLESYTLTVTLRAGVANIVLTYGSTTETFTSSGTANIDEGTMVSWTATPAPGYNMVQSSGTVYMNDNNTIAPYTSVKTFTITATWTPTDATPDLTWTLEWASGKALTGAVTDYVTMTVSADKKSVTLTFKKAFTSGQMILTCYATNNPSVKATCTVTCS